VAFYESVLDLIGNTPIVDISELSPSPRVRILAKLEGQNPGGSVKDRAAKQMILDAEKEGLLTPGSGQTILESSSGNTGIALAMICKIRGYHLRVVLPDNVSVERRQLLETWGAEVIDSPGAEGSNGAMRRAMVMAEEHPEWWFPFQYGNPSNPKAHYEETGPEIWRDVPELTHFIAGLGTAGTLMGVGRFLKEQNPDVQVWAIEPPAGEMVDGLKNIDEGFIPPVYEDNDGDSLLNRRVIVRPRESIEWTRRLTEVGVFAGISSGAILAGAVKAAKEIDGKGEEATIVTIVCDGGWKYLSAGVWTDDIDTVEARAKATIYF
jgi:cysteine synthase